MTPAYPFVIRVLSTPRPNGPPAGLTDGVAVGGIEDIVYSPTGVRGGCLVGGGCCEVDRDAPVAPEATQSSAVWPPSLPYWERKRARRDDDGDGRHHDGSRDHRAPQALDSLLHQKDPFYYSHFGSARWQSRVPRVERDCHVIRATTASVAAREHAPRRKHRCAQKKSASSSFFATAVGNLIPARNRRGSFAQGAC